MKYLSTYKLFEKLKYPYFLDLFDDIKDILLEVEDLGLFINKKSTRSKSGVADRIFCQITPTKDGSLSGKFEITQELADSLYRVSQYVKSKGCNFCTYEIHLSGDEWYQLSSSDILDYIGTEVWYIDIHVTDCNVNESITNIDNNNVGGDVESMLYDMEDLGYGYMVSPSRERSMPSNGFTKYGIGVLLYKRGQNTILLDDIDYRINQIKDIIKYDIENITIRFSQITQRGTFSYPPHPEKLKSLDDFSVKNLLDFLDKHFPSGINNNTSQKSEEEARNPSFDPSGSIPIEFQVLDNGMNEWREEFSYVGKQDGEYKFKSEMQWDDFEMSISESDLETDVRPVIKEISMKFINEVPD
jgi:hypothetical protein